MITVDKMGGINGINHCELMGLSTDTKPTDLVPNGSKFVEIDTMKTYLFDESNKVWTEQTNGDIIKY